MRTIAVYLTANVASYRAQMAAAGAATRQFGDQVSGVATSTDRNVQKSFQAVSRAAVVMGAALLAGFAVAARAAMNFDKEMSGVQAVSGATAAQMRQLRDAAIDMGARTSFSATQAARGQAELAKAGLSTAEILRGGLKGALDLAAAGQIEVASSATYVATTLGIFGLRGVEASRVADVLAASAAKSETDITGLGESLRQGGLVASQMGLSLEETVGTLSAFAKAGLIGSDAGTSLKTALQRLAAPTGEQRDLMQALGIQVFDASGNFVGLAGVAGQLQKALGGLTPEQRNAALATLFGADAVRAANVLYNQGEAGIRRYTAMVTDQGAASRMAAAQLDNLAGDLEALRGSIETVLIRSGSSANGTLRFMAQAATDVVNAVGDLPAPLQAAGVGFAGVGGSALVVLGSIGALLPHIRKGADDLARLGTAGRLASSGLVGLGKLGIVAVVVTSIAAAFAAANNKVEEMARGKPQIDALGGALLALAKDGQGIRDVFAKGRLDHGYVRLLIEDLGRIPKTAGEELRKQLDDIDRALAGLVAGGAPEHAATAVQRLAAALDMKPDKLEPFLDDYTRSLKENEGQTALTTAASEEQKRALEENARSAGTAEDAARRLAQKQQELRAAFESFGTPMSTYKRLLEERTEAERKAWERSREQQREAQRREAEARQRHLEDRQRREKEAADAGIEVERRAIDARVTLFDRQVREAAKAWEKEKRIRQRALDDELEGEDDALRERQRQASGALDDEIKDRLESVDRRKDVLGDQIEVERKAFDRSAKQRRKDLEARRAELGDRYEAEKDALDEILEAERDALDARHKLARKQLDDERGQLQRQAEQQKEAQRRQFEQERKHQGDRTEQRRRALREAFEAEEENAERIRQERQDAFAAERDDLSRRGETVKRSLEDRHRAERDHLEAQKRANEESARSWEESHGKVKVSLRDFAGALVQSSREALEWEQNLRVVAQRVGPDVADHLRKMGADGVELTRQMATGTIEQAQLAAQGITGHLRLDPAKAGFDEAMKLLTQLGKWGGGDIANALRDALAGGRTSYEEVLRVYGGETEKGMHVMTRLAEWGGGDVVAAMKTGLAGGTTTVNDIAKQWGFVLSDTFVETARRFLGDRWVRLMEQLRRDLENVLPRAGMDPNDPAKRAANEEFMRNWRPAGASRGAVMEFYAGGGARENHVAQVARGTWRVWAEPETGGEAYIPMASSKRVRSTAVLADVAQRFGYQLSPMADGGWHPVEPSVHVPLDGGAAGRLPTHLVRALEMIVQRQGGPMIQFGDVHLHDELDADRFAKRIEFYFLMGRGAEYPSGFDAKWPL